MAEESLHPKLKDRLHKINIFQKIGYEPHEGQQRIHFTDWKYHVAVWGRRSGKTIAAYAEGIAELAKRDRRIWIVAPDYSLTKKVFREVWQAVIQDEVLGPVNSVVSRKANNSAEMRIEMAWGSWIEAKSAKNPESLLGEGLDLLIIDEAAKVPQMVWDRELEPTLLDREGRALLITTPRGRNWIHRKWQLGQAQQGKGEGWDSTQFPTTKNPHVSVQFVEDKKAHTPPDIYRQEYEASFEHHSGLVWPDFRETHIPRGHLFNNHHFTPEPWMTHYRSIDPGLANPTACLWAAVDPENNVWVYQEYQDQNPVPEVHAETIRNETNFKVTTTFIDPAAERSGPDQSTYLDHLVGLAPYPAENAYESGVPAVGRYIRATLLDNSTHPKLFIHENCRQLREQLREYVWPEDSEGVEKNKPERPKKYKDHLCDALRYLLVMKPRFVRNEWEDASSGYMDDDLPDTTNGPSTGLR